MKPGRSIFGGLAALFRTGSANLLSLEKKLEILGGCGLRLESPFTIEDLLRSWKREDYDRSGFDLVLVGLGMTEEQAP